MLEKYLPLYYVGSNVSSFGKKFGRQEQEIWIGKSSSFAGSIPSVSLDFYHYVQSTAKTRLCRTATKYECVTSVA